MNEAILNPLCVSALSECCKISRTQLASTFQLALSEILQQLRTVSIFKEVVHMSFATPSAATDILQEAGFPLNHTSTLADTYSDSKFVAHVSSNEEEHVALLGSREVSQLCSSLQSVSHIIATLSDLLEFCFRSPSPTQAHALRSIGDSKLHEAYFSSLLLVASKASLHLLLSKHILCKDGDDVSHGEGSLNGSRYFFAFVVILLLLLLSPLLLLLLLLFLLLLFY